MTEKPKVDTKWVKEYAQKIVEDSEGHTTQEVMASLCVAIGAVIYNLFKEEDHEGVINDTLENIRQVVKMCRPEKEH